MMPESTDDSDKANINRESQVKEDSEYVRLVIRTERTDEVEASQSQSQSRRGSIVWWIKAILWCIFTVIIVLVSIKWGAPFLFKKGVPAKSGGGMAGSESNPASLLRLYIDYGRYTEATLLLLEYIESFASLRPADIIRRKRPFAVWFPYSLIERLWCQLQQSIKLGHMVDQSEKLKKLLQGAVMNHLHQLKVDSDDVISSVS